LRIVPTGGSPDALAAREIKGLSADSRGVTATWFFSRCREQKRMGWSLCRKQFSACCRHRRERAPDSPIGTATFVKTKDVRLALAQAAARLYRASPKQSLRSRNERQDIRHRFRAADLDRASAKPLTWNARRRRAFGAGRWLSDHAGSVSLHKTLDGLGAAASPISPWRRPRTAYCNAGSTVFASLRQPLPIFRETPRLSCNA